MNIDVHSKCKSLEKVIEFCFRENSILERALSGCDLQIGPASDSKYGVPAHAQDCVFCGDENWIGDKIATAQAEALMATDPSKMMIVPKYNPSTQHWDMLFTSGKGDRVAGDEFPTTNPDFVGGQLWSPWNISYMSKVFKEPLAYTNVDQYITYDAGSNPWAEIYTLFLEQYSGWAMTGQTGSLQNTFTADVNVKDGYMSAPVINISGTYSLTLEEQVRGTPGPFGSSPMARKQQYLSYVMNMIRAQIALFGNDETGTNGLVDIPTVTGSTPSGITTWPYESLTTIWKSTTETTRGSKIYRYLADILIDFLTSVDNKFGALTLVLSPIAHNILMSAPYSDVYNPETAMKIFAEDFLAGKGPGHTTPSINWIIEPFFKPDTVANPNPLLPKEVTAGSDLFAIICKEIKAGPTEESQPTYIFGAPLRKFVFPAIPGMYNTQYKTLERLAGVIAPVRNCMRIYQGLGLKAGA
jgi:hypothetical protein